MDAGMPKPTAVNVKATNEKGIEEAITCFRRHLQLRLQGRPDLYGSIQLTMQFTGGVMDRYRMTGEETSKIEPVSANR